MWRWTCYLSRSTKTVGSYLLITGFSMDCADKLNPNLQFFWMWDSVLRRLPYTKCITIWKTTRNAVESVDTWTSVLKDSRMKMRNTINILTAYQDSLCTAWTFKGLSRSNIISLTWLISPLRPSSSLFTCCQVPFLPIGWRLYSHPKLKIRSSWESTLNL